MKFKVGDRVRVKEMCYDIDYRGEEGRIHKIIPGAAWPLLVEFKSSSQRFFNESHLDLIEDAEEDGGESAQMGEEKLYGIRPYKNEDTMFMAKGVDNLNQLLTDMEYDGCNMNEAIVYELVNPQGVTVNTNFILTPKNE